MLLGAFFPWSRLETSAWVALGSFSRVTKVPRHLQCLPQQVSFSLILILCECDTDCFSNQLLLNPKKKKKLFCLCTPQTHTCGEVIGGSVNVTVSVVERGGEGPVASQLGEEGQCGPGCAWAQWAGVLTTPSCCVSSPDHSRSSKSSCWSSSDDKRGSSRSEHNASTSSKSLIPKEPRLDTFWD